MEKNYKLILSEQLKNLLLFVVILPVSYLLSPFFGFIFGWIANDNSLAAGYVGLAGIPLAYVFFITSSFIAFSWKGRYWWLTVGLLPAVIFAYTLDYPVYFLAFLVAGILDWFLGLSIHKIVSRKNSSV